MPRPRFQRLPEDKRDAILRTAAREFAEHGLHAASLNHILAAAGLSKGAAYYYFDDKADLFATVAQHYLAHVMRDARFDLSALSARTFWPRVAGLMRRSFEQAREWPEMQGLAKALWSLPRDEREREPLRSLFTQFRELAAGVLARGQELGVLRTDLPTDFLLALALAIDEATDQWLAEHSNELGPAEYERITQALLGLWEAVLSPPRAGTRALPTARNTRRRAPP